MNGVHHVHAPLRRPDLHLQKSFASVALNLQHYLDLNKFTSFSQVGYPILSRIAQSLHHTLRQLALREPPRRNPLRYTPYSTSSQDHSAVMGSHRKGVRKYYAVRHGNKPGVYHTYDDCLGQVRGFKGAICKLILQPRRHGLLLADERRTQSNHLAP